MTIVRYPLSALAPDAMRAATGLVFTLAPMLLMSLAPVAAFVLGALAALFGLFAIQVLRRWRTRFEYDEEGLRVLPGGACVPWVDIDRLSLRWFSLRRESIGRGFASPGRSRRVRALEIEPDGNGAIDGASLNWRRQGWLELEVRVGAQIIRLDSRLEHFEDIVRLASTLSPDGLTLDAATVANLALLGDSPAPAASTPGLLAS